MIYLRSLKVSAEGMHAYPFNKPSVRTADINFGAPVSIIIGENGSGKSTLLEGLARLAELPSIGHEDAQFDKTLDGVDVLADHMSLTWSVKSRRGFFLRAEDFFGFAKRMNSLRREMLEDLARVDEEYKGKSSYTKGLARMSFANSLYEMEEKYGDDLDAASHGESFLDMFKARIVPNGLYIMDEPEAPLSPLKQLTLLTMLHEAAGSSQFIIATHSPILMAFPGAEIWSMDEKRPVRVEWGDIEHVTIMCDFLHNPDMFLRHLLN